MGIQVHFGNGLDVFFRCFIMVSAAEIFDKSWFIGLLLALRFNRMTVFSGAISALILHAAMAVALGFAFAKFIPKQVMCFLAAALFAVFAFLYLKDWYYAEPGKDAIAAGREEAANECDLSSADGDSDGAEDSENGEAVNKDADSVDSEATTSKCSSEWLVFTKAFMAVFVAEWGDRTQFAIVGQALSQPAIPVFLGSGAAFALLTLTAVAAGALLSNWTCSETILFLISGIIFAIFAVLSLIEGLNATE